MSQPWIHSRRGDLAFILLPAFLASFIAIAISIAGRTPEVSPAIWVVLVLGIDVSHVYATLFRTYFDPKERAKQGLLFTIVPVLLWVTGLVLYTLGALTFWRALAYLAVFHFIRQQYGFFRIYARGETLSPRERRIENSALYLSMLFPIVYWHAHPRVFHWFLDGDFLAVPGEWSGVLTSTTGALFLLSLVMYFRQEFRRYRKDGFVNLPKSLLLLGTALSWNTGIVVLNSDFAFTLTNVVTHGVPYMALVFWRQGKPQPRAIGVAWSWVPYLALLLVFAFTEEALWNRWVWQEYSEYFGWLNFLRPIESESLRRLVIPLLALPQATHYILDGFIWRLRPDVGKEAFRARSREGVTCPS